VNIPSPGAHLRTAVATLIALVLLGGVAAAASKSDGKAAVTATDERSSSETPRSTTTEATTTTLPLAPEGGSRSGTALDTAPGAPTTDPLDRGVASTSLLSVLDSIPVQPEASRTGYDHSLFPSWDDDDHDGCDTRCEVLGAQRRTDGTWLSEWDGYVTDLTTELHVDHVVALAEAWDSGANTWTAAERDEFADYLPNLLAVTAAENLRKSDADAAEWFPSRADANCLWSSTVVRVKAHWHLSVDQAEHDALANLLRSCSDYVEPTTTTTSPPTTLAPPTTKSAPPAAVPAPFAGEASPSNDCTPGYDPCIPPGSDVDCEGGGGNGPRYVSGPVSVSGSDPYGLDTDGNGVGCQ
jgi:hypothetical protein